MIRLAARIDLLNTRRLTMVKIPLPIQPLVVALTMAITMVLLGAPTVNAKSNQSDQETAQRLDAIAGANVQANRTIGLVAAVVQGSDTLLMEAYGRADIEWDVPMQVDAMFAVGSIAKQFTAAAILQLRDAGKLSLDNEITKWLPDLEAGDSKITLRHLLSHTSGVFQFDNTREWESNLFDPRVWRDVAYSLIELQPLQFPTGEVQAYSNAGFWLLGLVVEKASEMTFEDYLDTQIFEPLGMSRSMYCDDFANVSRRAHGYGMGNGSIRRAPMISYRWVFTPGAMCSTAGDLITWLQALHGGRVLSEESYAEMTTPATLTDGTPLQYGMGIKVGENNRGLKYIGHGGSAPGFRADAMWYPDSQTAVVVLINTSPTSVSPARVGAALAREVLSPIASTDTYYTGDATQLVGIYEHILGGNQEGLLIGVVERPDGLAFSINGSPPQFVPWAGGLTFYPSETVTLTFRQADDGSGAVTELRRDDAGNHYILRKR